MWSILAVLTILPSTMAGEPCPDWGDITAGQGAEVGLTHREPTGHIDGMTTGDFNGDGVADLVVASLHTPDLPDRGSTIHVHFGPLLPTYLFTMESLQDDSVTITVSATDVSVGGQLANAGDLDGDGVDDLLVGTTEPGGSFPTGKVWAISLASPIAADLDLELDAFATFTGTNALDRFGVSLAGLGDVNGDGYRDVIIGAPDTSSGGRTENGEALIWYGPISGAYTAAGANVRVRSTGNLHNAGSALGYVGDLQNDGYDDIAVAVPGFGIRGGVMIIDGGPLPPAITPATADHVVEGRPDSRLGSTIQAAGDINHDGAADVWLASSPNSMRSGLHLLLGGTIPPGRSEAPPELIGYASQADDYGVSIATGDFNADGELDLYWASRNTGLLHPYYHYEILHGPFQLPARSSGDVRYNQVGTGGFVPDVAVADINDDGYDDAIRTEPVADTPGLNNVYVDFGGTGTRTTVNFYPDDDADSFGDYERAAWYLPACAAQAGFVTNTPEDCDDTNALINPGMVEDCGETDINCDGRIHVRPDGSRPLWFTDADNDGFGDRGALIEACTPPPGVVANDEDCDDTRPDIHPMAPEICDGVDNDCTGAGYLGGEVRLVEPADRISLGRMHLTALAVGTTRSGERSGEPMDLLFGGAVGIEGYTINWLSVDALGGPIDLASDRYDGTPHIRQDFGPYAGRLEAPMMTGYFTGDPTYTVAFANECGVLAMPERNPSNWQNPCYLNPPQVPILDTYHRTTLAKGDFDGDGLEDLLSVGTVAYADYNGAILYYGTQNLFDNTIAPSYTTEAVAYNGTATTTLGPGAAVEDLDGDGYDELIFSNPKNLANPARLESGVIGIVWGGPVRPTALEPTWIEFEARYSVGREIAALGDVDGDGDGDILINSRNGSPWLLRGNPSRDFPALLSAANTVHFVGVPVDVSSSISAAGDVDGDGRADLLIGTPYDDALLRDAGSAYLVYGATDFDAVGPRVDLTALEGLGRLAPGTTEPLIQAASGRGVVGAWLRWTVPHDLFAQKMFPLGDLNGDGADDLAFKLQNNEVQIIYGGRFGIDDPPPETLPLWLTDHDADGYPAADAVPFPACPLRVPIRTVNGETRPRAVTADAAPEQADCDDADHLAYPGSQLGPDCALPPVGLPPTLTVTLGPDPLGATTAAEATVTAEDPDGDALTTTWRWSVDGVAFDHVTGPTLSEVWFTAGQTVEVEAAVSDGSYQVSASASRVVEADLPTLWGCTVSPSAPRRDQAVTATPYGLQPTESVPAPTVQIQWQERSGIRWIDIPGATGPTLASCDARGATCNASTMFRAVCTPEGAFGPGPSVISSVVTVLNSPPVIDRCVSTPAIAYAGDTLTADVAASDPDGDAVTVQVGWYSGVGPWATLLSVAPTFPLTVDHILQPLVLACTAVDARGASSARYWAVPNTTEDHPPEPAIVTFSPPNPTSEDDLSVTWPPLVDADVGQLTYANITWLVNGQPLFRGEPSQPVDRDWFRRGDVVTVRVVAFNTSSSAPAEATVTIADAPPRLTAVRLWPDAPTAQEPLFAMPEGAFDHDGDTITWDVVWTVNGAPVPTPAPEPRRLLAGAYAAGDVVVATLTPFDGERWGAPVSSTPITIANSPPATPSLSVSPAAPYDTSDLRCALARPLSDPDGDVVAPTTRWLRNGAVVAGQAGTTLPAALTTLGDRWACAVTVTDGRGGTAQATSPTVTVQATNLPSAPSLQPLPAFSNLTAHRLTGRCEPARCVTVQLRCDDGVAVDTYSQPCGAGSFEQVIAADRGLRTSCAARCLGAGRTSPPSASVAVTVADPVDTWETAGAYGDRADVAVATWPALAPGDTLDLSGNVLDEWQDRADWLRFELVDDPIADAAAGLDRSGLHLDLVDGAAEHDLWVWRDDPLSAPLNPTACDSFAWTVADRGDAPDHPAAANPAACALPGDAAWRLYNRCDDQSGPWWVLITRGGPDTGAGWELEVRAGP